MKRYNLKIPLAIVSNYKLSALAVLIYGEIYGICSKKQICYITDKTLMKRHHSNKASIQKAISELKKASLIKRLPSSRKEERKLELLSTAETKGTVNRFILIPDYLLNDASLKRIDELVYGYLVSESKKQEKINLDKKLNNSIPFVITTKSNLAKVFHNSTRTIKRSLARLENAEYLNYDSINGKYLEIEIFNHDEIFTRKMYSPDHQLLHFIPLGKRCSLPPVGCINLCQNRVSTYDKIEYRPMTKMSIDLCQNRVTNRILNRVINKDKKIIGGNKDLPRVAKTDNTPLYENELIDKPFYFDSLPSENDIPPETRKESYKDIETLNEISIQQSTSKYYKDQTLRDTAKSGSGDAKDNHLSSKNKQGQNKKDSANHSKQESSKTPSKTKSKQYQPYNGFNLDYQCKELQSILRHNTGRQYIITRSHRSLIEQRLKDGFDLNDFETVIIYLKDHGQSISTRDLLINISNYKHKINSN